MEKKMAEYRREMWEIGKKRGEEGIEMRVNICIGLADWRNVVREL